MRLQLVLIAVLKISSITSNEIYSNCLTDITDQIESGLGESSERVTRALTELNEFAMGTMGSEFVSNVTGLSQQFSEGALENAIISYQQGLQNYIAEFVTENDLLAIQTAIENLAALEADEITQTIDRVSQEILQILFADFSDVLMKFQELNEIIAGIDYQNELTTFFQGLSEENLNNIFRIQSMLASLVQNMTNFGGSMNEWIILQNESVMAGYEIIELIVGIDYDNILSKFNSQLSDEIDQIRNLVSQIITIIQGKNYEQLFGRIIQTIQENLMRDRFEEISNSFLNLVQESGIENYNSLAEEFSTEVAELAEDSFGEIMDSIEQLISLAGGVEWQEIFDQANEVFAANSGDFFRVTMANFIGVGRESNQDQIENLDRLLTVMARMNVDLNSMLNNVDVDLSSECEQQMNSLQLSFNNDQEDEDEGINKNVVIGLSVFAVFVVVLLIVVGLYFYTQNAKPDFI